MTFDFERSFTKEYERIKNPKLASEINEAISNVSKAKSIIEIKNLKKIVGHKTAYRIRTGDYRIGVFIENQTITFAAFDHRSKIYKRFP